MRWRTVYQQKARDFHRWFAWFPVVMVGQVVWLEVVERKWVMGSDSNYWEYREKT